MISALGLYFRLLAWMLGQIITGILALCMIPFAPKRQHISAGNFYDD